MGLSSSLLPNPHLTELANSAPRLSALRPNRVDGLALEEVQRAIPGLVSGLGSRLNLDEDAMALATLIASHDEAMPRVPPDNLGPVLGRRKKPDDGLTPGERAVQKVRQTQAAKPKTVVKTYVGDKLLATGIAKMEREGYRVTDRTSATPFKHRVEHTVRFEKK